MEDIRAASMEEYRATGGVSGGVIGGEVGGVVGGVVD